MLKAFQILQEDERRKEERDERKRKYNAKWNDEVLSCLFVFRISCKEMVPCMILILFYHTGHS